MRMINNKVQRGDMMRQGMMRQGMMQPGMNPEPKQMMAQGGAMLPAAMAGVAIVPQPPSRMFNTNGMRPPKATRIPATMVK